MSPHEPLVTAGHGRLARVGVAVSHGFTGSPAAMRPWAEHLAGQGFAVNMPLLPGHGTRWEDLARTTWQEWYLRLEAAYLELSGRCDIVFVAGLSMGGTLALRIAEHHPVAGLALVNPGLSMVDKRGAISGVLKYALTSVPAIGNDLVKPDVDEHAYDRVPVAAVHQLRQLFLDTRRNLPAITAPILLFRSTVDHVVADSSVTTLVEGVSSHRVDLRKLHNSYHVATLDHDAPQILAQSSAFFMEVAGLRPGALGASSPAPESAS
ncbi:alpha/beta hydrolase [Psychromicrobium xiongbiense]|uniref:alpha/beta hydrolase n=1 Tax=Psychromicrobium xiongbiense TaxID=3051184 RepID=UPI0025535DF6|nr:alpha/beta fold hydrolase [Psychromicrobium sp. YIM S02556]